MEQVLSEIYDAIVAGNKATVEKKVTEALGANLDASVILKESMIPALREVGNRFERGECFVPEMLVAAHAMKAGVAILRPQLMRSNLRASGKVVIGTVQGDVHDIGKNLVIMMLEGAGYQVHDLGTNVSPAKFIDAIRTIQPHVVGMSALLTTTMPNMKVTIESLKKAGVREEVKVLVGGAPVTEAYGREIGADGYASDASAAVRKVHELMNLVPVR